MLFVVGFALGAVLAWLLVSWCYFEALKKAGYLDSRGRWIRIPAKWDPIIHDQIRTWLYTEPGGEIVLDSELIDPDGK